MIDCETDNTLLRGLSCSDGNFSCQTSFLVSTNRLKRICLQVGVEFHKLLGIHQRLRPLPFLPLHLVPVIPMNSCGVISRRPITGIPNGVITSTPSRTAARGYCISEDTQRHSIYLFLSSLDGNPSDSLAHPQKGVFPLLVSLTNRPPSTYKIFS
jgi:hypothetical protein